MYENAGLQVSAASPRYLLALKLLAARPEQDADDIRFLYGLLKLRTAQEGLDVLLAAYPETRILPRARFMLEEMFGA